MYFYRVLASLSVIISSATVHGLHWGGYEGEEILLPCVTDPLPPLEDRWVVWWSVNNTFIGSYIPGDGFQPPSTKYHIDSIYGFLEINDLVQGEDDGTYDCFITSQEISGDFVNHTGNVTLTVGRRMSPISVDTNGSFYDSCYEHIGLGPATCSVLSYPQSNITWTLKVSDDDYCQRMIDDANHTCWFRQDGLWSCSSSISPISGCFGEYRCHVEYTLGENLRTVDTECIYGKEYVPGAWMSAFAIAMIAIFATIIAAVVFVLIVMAACGVITFAGCACLGGAGAAGAGCAVCCCKKSKQVNPEEAIQCDALRGNPGTMATGPLESKVTMEPPPPYSPL